MNKVYNEPKREKTHCICLRCTVGGKKFEWDSRVECPAECPNCHSSCWDTPRKLGINKDKKGNALKYQVKGV